MMKSLLQLLPRYPHIRADDFWTNLLLRSELWRQHIATKKFGRFASTAKMDTRINIQYPKNIFIGEKVKLQNGIYLVANETDQITIEDYAIIAKDVFMTTASYDVKLQENLIRDIPPLKGSICIRKGAFIGWGSIIYPNVEVGEKSIVPPFSVVCSNVKPHSIWVPTGQNPIEK